MSVLISLATAKTHLRVTTTDTDDDIYLKVVQASAIILKYLNGRADVTWDDTTVPGQVQAAILLMLTRLYEQRGDDEKADADCWLAIERVLRQSHDSALA